MQKKLLLITSLLSVGVFSNTWACNGSHVLGSGSSGAAYTISAATMQEGSFSIGLNLETLQNKSLSDTSMIEALQNGVEHLHNVDALNSYSLSLSYGITDTLTLNMQLPYSERTNIRAGEANGGSYEVHPHGDSQGLGDTAAILQYKLYDEAVQVALLGGVKLPTGKTGIRADGEVLEADLQPGSGSIDFFAGLALTKEFKDFSLHSDILYKYNNEGIQKSRLGDVFTYNVALSYRLTGDEHILHELNEVEHFDFSTSLFVELNGESAQKDKFDGINADNTGHSIIFGTTGLSFVSEGGYSLFTSISLPIYQNFNGVQNSVEYKASLGLAKSF